MEEWQERVRTELLELANRIAKLKDFINHPNFEQMVPDGVDLGLMRVILSDMCAYASFLELRMGRWKK